MNWLKAIAVTAIGYAVLWWTNRIAYSIWDKYVRSGLDDMSNYENWCVKMVLSIVVTVGIVSFLRFTAFK